MTNKPLTIVCDEFVKQLANLINQSDLPFFIIESILKDTHNEVARLAKKQLEADKKRYEEALQYNNE